MLRIPEKTREKLEKMSGIEPNLENPLGTVYEVICHYVDLVDNYYRTERGEPTQYSPETGKPLAWSWSPDERFEQIRQGQFLTEKSEITIFHITEGGPGIGGERIKLLSEDTLKLVREKIWDELPLYVEINDTPYVIEKDHVLDSTWDDNYYTKPGIVIRPLRKQLTSTGLEDLTSLQNSVDVEELGEEMVYTRPRV